MLDDQFDPDRQNAMLTRAQREFLLGDGSGRSRQDRRGKREQIRKRVRNTMLDFAILFDRWEKHDEDAITDFVGDIFDDEGMKKGLNALIAMLYMASPYSAEGVLQMVLLHGVTMAEHEMSNSDMRFPKDVDVSIDQVKKVDYENAIEKFRRNKLSDMTDAEAKAIVRLFDKTPTVDSEDLHEIRSDLFNYREEQLSDDWGEALEDRVENRNQRRGRQHDRD